MPKPEPSATGPRLTASDAASKIAGMITESEPETRDETPAVEAAKPQAAAPAATEDAPPETPPPATSDTDAPPESPDDATLHEFPVDGEPVSVSLGELKRSYSFQAHNTQRAQELAEKEKRLEPEIRQRVEAEVAEDRVQYQRGIAEIRQALEQLHGEPDWLERRKVLSDADFLKEKADWEVSRAQTQRLKAEEERVANLNREAAERQFTAYLRAEEDKLRTAIPEWKDAEKGQTELAKLRAFTKTAYGFSDEQVRAGFQSAATVLLVRDAMRYRELQREPSASAKAKTPAIRTAKPGATPPPPPANAQQQALIQRAAQSHRLRDAAKAVEALLGD